MNFYIYDLIFLVLFCLIIGLFLWKKRDNVKREMKIAFLYKTQLGVKLINYVGRKFKKTLNVLQYVIIGLGYFLMAGILYLLGKSVYEYVRYPELTEVIKAPPIAPVIPYFPKLFQMESFFPPFYFTYFIVAIAVVAVFHEFFHGIFMKFHNIRIKSTGIAFFGPLLGAFVEQNEKDMEKAPKKSQLSILGAGVFANILLAIIFFFLWWLLFSVSFVPMGATFDSYVTDEVNISSIKEIGGINISNQEEILTSLDKVNNSLILSNGDSLNLTLIKTENKSYFMEPNMLKEQIKQNLSSVYLYYDLPAIRNGLKGNIIEINRNKIKKYSELSRLIESYAPGDMVNVKTNYKGEILKYNFELGEDPNNEGRAVFGIGNSVLSNMRFEEKIAFFKEPFTEYESKNDFSEFIYYLLFWIFLINFLVAFFNMLPFTILDGGRFFYLTVWGITGNEKIGKWTYKWLGNIILFGFLLMMIVWFVRII